jgi:1-acyl-sn-glycerol-3-phosphate acyltransferase
MIARHYASRIGAVTLDRLRLLTGYAGLYAGLTLLVVMLLTATVMCLVVIGFTTGARRRSTGRRIVSLTFRAYLKALQAIGLLRADLDALDSLTNDSGLVIAPNHPCLLDAVLVISRLPNVACIMKAELWNNPLLGIGARVAGYIRNDSAHFMVRRAVEDLRRDGHLLVFPEGTRTLRPPINPLTRVCALIAKRAEVPLQVIFIETNSRFLCKGWPLWRKPEFPLSYRVRLGPRLPARDNVEELTAQLVQCYEREFSERRPRAQAFSAPADAHLDA